MQNLKKRRTSPLRRLCNPTLWIALGVGALLMGGVVALQKVRLADRISDSDETQLTFLPNVEAAPLLFAGHHSTVSKLIWVRGAIYAGDASLRGATTPWMLHMVDLITSLDPHHKWSYQMAGTSLRSEENDDDLKILKRGSETYHDDWMLNLLYVLRLVEKKQDYATAALIMERFKNDQEAPEFVREIYKTYQVNRNDLPQALMIYLGDYVADANKFYKKAIGGRLTHMMLKKLQSKEPALEKAILAELERLDSGERDLGSSYRALLALAEQTREDQEAKEAPATQTALVEGAE